MCVACICGHDIDTCDGQMVARVSTQLRLGTAARQSLSSASGGDCYAYWTPVLTFWQSRAARGFRSLDLIPIGAGTVLSIQHVVMPAREAMEAGLGSSVRQNRTHLTSTTSVCHPLRIHIVVPLDEASFRHAPRCLLPASCQ